MKNKKCNVFLIDDNEMYCNLLEHCFQKYVGKHIQSVRTFSTGEACLKELTRSSPDIVVLDYYLDSKIPGAKNGVDILRKIKSVNRNARVIMLSSQETIDVAVNSLKLGASDYVVKNEQAFDQLQAAVEKISKALTLKIRLKRIKVRNIIILTAYFFLILGLIIYAKREHWEF